MTTNAPGPVGTVDPRFSAAGAAPAVWPDVERLLAEAELYWLTTVRRDGRPHTAPLVGVWHDGAFAFCTGRGEQKERNLARDSQVTVTAGGNRWTDGTDVVVEGRAVRVTGRDRLEPLAAAWREKYRPDWAWQADEDGFVDDDGTRPLVYVVEPAKVIVFGKGTQAAQTTFRF